MQPLKFLSCGQEVGLNLSAWSLVFGRWPACSLSQDAIIARPEPIARHFSVLFSVGIKVLQREELRPAAGRTIDALSV